MHWSDYDAHREMVETLQREATPYNEGYEAERCAAYDGQFRPEQEWVLSSFDTWVRNPYYTGEPGPHPEEEPDDFVGPCQPLSEVCDIPF